MPKIRLNLKYKTEWTEEQFQDLVQVNFTSFKAKHDNNFVFWPYLFVKNERPKKDRPFVI